LRATYATLCRSREQHRYTNNLSRMARAPRTPSLRAHALWFTLFLTLSRRERRARQTWALARAGRATFLPRGRVRWEVDRNTDATTLVAISGALLMQCPRRRACLPARTASPASSLRALAPASAALYSCLPTLRASPPRLPRRAIATNCYRFRAGAACVTAHYYNALCACAILFLLHRARHLPAAAYTSPARGCKYRNLIYGALRRQDARRRSGVCLQLWL